MLQVEDFFLCNLFKTHFLPINYCTSIICSKAFMALKRSVFTSVKDRMRRKRLRRI
jgi:hypothetical protein